jgi:ribosomal protein S18 acetylase RimI-like enzyme
MSITFVPLAAADYDEVLALWQASEGVGAAESRAELESYLARNPGLSLVARDGGRIVGAVMCGHDGRRGYLYHLAVATSHRGRGIGRAIVERCLNNLRSLGLRRCTIFLFVHNESGEKFWRQLGFRERTDLKAFAYELTMDN